MPLHQPLIAPRDATGMLRMETDADASGADLLAGWRIYTRAASAGDWLSLKLVRMRPGKGRGRYWVGWNTKSKRLARTRDAGDMPEALRDALVRDLQMCALDGSMDAAAMAGMLAECDALDAARGRGR